MDELAPTGVPPLSFALFIGVALAVTAFPVLARILTDRGMAQTELGVLALSCAAVDDVTAWCLLAFVAGVVQVAGRRRRFAWSGCRCCTSPRCCSSSARSRLG